MAELNDPVFLNFGVSEVNWWLHYEFAPVCSRTVLVAYDKLAEWDVMAPRKPVLEQVRAQLLASSDTVVGLSEGSIDDVPDASYVGHGVDRHWHDPAIDSLPEPADLAAIPRPRAVYVGALSMRFDVEAVRVLADTGIDVVLVGMAPQPALVELATRHPAHPPDRRAPPGAGRGVPAPLATSASCLTPTSRSRTRWSRTRRTTTPPPACRPSRSTPLTRRRSVRS